MITSDSVRAELFDGLPLEESSVLGCAIFTAYGAVRHGSASRLLG